MDKSREVFLKFVLVLGPLVFVSASSVGPLALSSPVYAQVSPLYGGILKVDTAGNPISCDLPTRGGFSLYSVVSCSPMLNQLVKYSPTNPQEIVPDVAQSWEMSGDGLTWTFRLTPGIKWHDGTTLTASDVLFSLTRILDPPEGVIIGPQAAILQSYIQSVETPDALTLRITTNFPAPSLLANLASAYVSLYPKTATEALVPPSMQTPCQVIGSGPFKCQEYIPNVVTRLERFQDYFVPGRPFFDGIEVYVIADANTRLAAIITGQLHVLPLGIAAEQAVGLDSFGITVQQPTINLATTLILNTTRAPFDDIRVRSAMNLALDRDAAVAALGGTKGGLMLPGGQWALPSATLLARPGYRQPKNQDIAEANRLLDEVFGKGVRFNTTILADTLRLQAAEFVADQLLAHLNINASLRILDLPVYVANVQARSYGLAIDSVGEPLDDVDLMFSNEYQCNAPENYTGLCDAQTLELFTVQQRTLNPATRLNTVHQLIGQAMDQNNLLVLAWNKRYVPVRNTVADFQIHPAYQQNLRWQDVWFADAPAPTPTPSTLPVPTATPIPGLMGWGLVVSAMILTVLAYLTLRRKPVPG